jgi:predicted nucleic acid-binding protein
MKLAEALDGVTALGIDTAPLIYFVEGHATFLELMRVVIQRIDAGQITGYSSVVTLTEVLTQPLRQGNPTLEVEYRTLLLNSRNFILLAITAEIAELAAELRARHNLRTPDALQIAAALYSGCQAFLTNDQELARVSDLRIIVLGELEF